VITLTVIIDVPPARGPERRGKASERPLVDHVVLEFGETPPS
jgi:hypothetical protein